jgi:hypothetical protein
MKRIDEKRTLSELTIEELERRRQEIQFMGSQYAMNGCDAPRELTVEWEALQRELAVRAGL